MKALRVSSKQLPWLGAAAALIIALLVGCNAGVGLILGMVCLIACFVILSRDQMAIGWTGLAICVPAARWVGLLSLNADDLASYFRDVHLQPAWLRVALVVAFILAGCAHAYLMRASSLLQVQVALLSIAINVAGLAVCSRRDEFAASALDVFAWQLWERFVPFVVGLFATALAVQSIQPSTRNLTVDKSDQPTDRPPTLRRSASPSSPDLPLPPPPLAARLSQQPPPLQPSAPLHQQAPPQQPASVPELLPPALRGSNVMHVHPEDWSCSEESSEQEDSHETVDLYTGDPRALDQAPSMRNSGAV